jgi:hypothetical protein
VSFRQCQSRAKIVRLSCNQPPSPNGHLLFGTLFPIRRRFVIQPLYVGAALYPSGLVRI